MKCKNIKNKDKNKIDSMLKFISLRLKTIGVKVSYSALLLYYAYNNTDTPRWAKNIILGSLAYLLSPFDSIPDLTPLLGFTDDLGVLSFGLVTIACYVDEEVREKAKGRLQKLFKVVDEEDLLEIDSKL